MSSQSITNNNFQLTAELLQNPNVEVRRESESDCNEIEKTSLVNMIEAFTILEERGVYLSSLRERELFLRNENLPELYISVEDEIYKSWPTCEGKKQYFDKDEFLHFLSD